MAQQPLATKGNFLHIYDFRVTKGKEDEFIRLFEEFDYSDSNPMHKSWAQVKDGVLCRDTQDPQRFFLIAEWSDIEEHARIRKVLANEIKPEFIKYIEGGTFVPKYVEVVLSTPDEILNKAAAEGTFAARFVHVLPIFHLVSASHRTGVQAARIHAALRELAEDGASNARVPGDACPRLGAFADRWRAIFHPIDGHHRISGRGLPAPAAYASGRAGTPLRAGGIANHRLRYSPPQQRARAQVYPDAIRCRRGGDQKVVWPLDRRGAGRLGGLRGRRRPRRPL